MKTSERKFRITGNTCSHDFKIGSVVTIEIDDGSNFPRMTDRKSQYWVFYSDMEEITDRKPSPLSRLYTAIVGALFWPYHRDRYQDGER
jgi:hypothetical protein